MVGVMCSLGKGCVALESTSAQCVAYGETTVRPYLCIFNLSPVWVMSAVLPPLHEKGYNMPGQGIDSLSLN